MNIQFEYKEMNTPQQHHLADLDFTEIAAMTREKMSHANLNQESCLVLCKEASHEASS